jgi:hypothetical protein
MPIHRAPAYHINVNGVLIPVKKVKKPIDLIVEYLSDVIEDATGYIEELQETADFFIKDRDYWKARALKAEETAAELDDEAEQYEKDLTAAENKAECYRKQAEIYAKEKQTAELKAIAAAKIIEEAGIKLTEAKTVRPDKGYIKAEEAAEILTAVNKLDLYA